MIKFKNITHPLRWFMTLAVTVLAVGCGNGDPILGGGGAGVPGTLVDVIKPRVTQTLPATTNPGPTAGPAANAAITASFTEMMAPATINHQQLRRQAGNHLYQGETRRRSGF